MQPQEHLVIPIPLSQGPLFLKASSRLYAADAWIESKIGPSTISSKTLPSLRAEVAFVIWEVNIFAWRSALEGLPASCWPNLTVSCLLGAQLPSQARPCTKLNGTSHSKHRSTRQGIKEAAARQTPAAPSHAKHGHGCHERSRGSRKLENATTSLVFLKVC